MILRPSEDLSISPFVGAFPGSAQTTGCQACSTWETRQEWSAIQREDELMVDFLRERPWSPNKGDMPWTVMQPLESCEDVKSGETFQLGVASYRVWPPGVDPTTSQDIFATMVYWLVNADGEVETVGVHSDLGMTNCGELAETRVVVFGINVLTPTQRELKCESPP